MDGISEMVELANTPLRVVLLANWGLGTEILNALSEDVKVTISLVISQHCPNSTDPWKNVVYDRAVVLGYPVLKLSEFSDDSSEAMAALHTADLLVVHAYPRRLLRTVFDAARLGCINVHPSLLPKHRGRNPSAVVLRMGESKTGLTAHYMDDGLDTGPILHQVAVPVEPHDSRGSLVERMKMVVPELVTTTVAKVVAGTKAVAQDSVVADNSITCCQHNTAV